MIKRKTGLAILSFLLVLSGCGGGGSDSGGGGGEAIPLERLYGQYRGTLGDDVNVALTITHYDRGNAWPARGRVTLTRKDGSCRVSAPWGTTYDEDSASMSSHWSEQLTFYGSSMRFDGKTIRDISGGSYAYGGSQYRNCSPLVTGKLELTKQ